MGRLDLTAEIHKIESTIREMNRCWTEKWDEARFREYIHPDAVAIVPTTSGRLEGQDAYVSGWRAFCETAVIRQWKESNHKVQVFAGGKSAVVTCFFSITFEIGGQMQIMHGRDMFFLIKEGRKWLVVADQFSPEPISR